MLRLTAPHPRIRKNNVLRSLFLHTSSPLHTQFLKSPPGGKNASRTRLTNSMKMKPGFKSANIEVAPKAKHHNPKLSRDLEPRSREVPFVRESPPHTDPKYISMVKNKVERNPSFKRRIRGRDQIEQSRGTWDISRGQNSGKDRLGQGIDQSRQRIPEKTWHPKYTRDNLPIVSEFSQVSTVTSFQGPTQPPTRFTSPPLMPGILSCLKEVLGPTATPTPIQALSLKWLLGDAGSGRKQFLLASETGSGKSIAYLLPLLQSLKQTELDVHTSPSGPSVAGHNRALNPRALILAPTHELARQLSMSAKSLLHEVKLRVLCASRANLKTTKEQDATARQMVTRFNRDHASGEFEVKRERFPVDVVVGTPMKLLEMVRGRGWDRKEDLGEDEGTDAEPARKPRRGRDKVVGFGKWRSQPEMGLANVEWVIVDEADVLFDSDFQETTRQLLADISAARGQPVPLSLSSPSGISSTPNSTTKKMTIEYPFNFILTSATIPSSLASYLDTYHPKLVRLASPHLHHLPKTLQTEYVSWTGGNKYADIERRIRRVWAEDASSVGLGGKVDRNNELSKILIFCNKSNKVDDLGAYLQGRGIKNIALSSTSDQRKRGSNHHLDGFLRMREDAEWSEPGTGLGNNTPAEVCSFKEVAKVAEPLLVASDGEPDTPVNCAPHVMITTSLLSRGLDFSPSIRHVFIVDEPRNMIDFLHRAGRTGRAGERGKVVIFGKMKGRGSARTKDVKRKVGSLVVH